MNEKELINFINENAPAITEIHFSDEVEPSYWCLEGISESGKIIMMQTNPSTNESFGGMRAVEIHEFKGSKVKLVRNIINE